MIQELVFVFSALLTYFLGKLSKKFNWNETLPIPIQNIIIGLLVFGVVILYQKITGQTIIVQDIIQQIYYTLGGSGLATLVYDANKSTEDYK